MAGGPGTAGGGPPREVVTVQLGPEGCFAGAHYWNFQDEVAGGGGAEAAVAAGGALHRGGGGPGAPVTPRLVAVDLKGCRGSLRQSRDDAGEAASAAAGSVAALSTWNGPPQVHVAEPVAKNEFLRCLEEEEEEEEEETEEEDGYGSDDDGDDDYADRRRGPAGKGAAAGPRGQRDGGGEPPPTPPDAFEEKLRAAARELAGSTVEYWSDYSKYLLHPKTVYEVPGAWAGSGAFGEFGEGLEAAARPDVREEVLERIRGFVEECDYFGGFQCFADAAGGFAGFASRLFEDVRDDYRGQPLLVAELEGASRAEAGAAAGGETAASAERAFAAERALGLYDLNRGLAAEGYGSVADCYVPLLSGAGAGGRAPGMAWAAGDRYQRTGVAAALLDTLTLPYCLAAGAGPAVRGRTDLAGLVRAVQGRFVGPFAALGAALPPVWAAGGGGGSASARDLARGMASWTPGIAASGRHVHAELYTLRGARRRAAGGGVGPAAADADDVVSDLLEALRGQPLCLRTVAVSPHALPVPLTFPRVFRAGGSGAGPAVAGAANAATGGGGGDARAAVVDVAEVALATKAFSSSQWEARLTGLGKRFAAATRSGEGLRLLQSWGMEADDAAERAENLRTHAGRYVGDHDGLSSGDDSDEEDA